MKRKNELENSIIHLTCMLNKLKTVIDDNEEYNMAYNRLLIQRAELRKELSEISTYNIIELFNQNMTKLSQLNSKKHKKLICDYFS